jgi:biotin carboxylase
MAAANSLGVDVTVGCEEASTMTALNPAGLVTLDFRDPAHAARQAAQFAARFPIGAVVPADDQVAVAGAAIAQAIGLPSNSVESVEAARNKHRMRELLARSGVPQPRFRLSSFAEDRAGLARDVDYPCVVKPLGLAASQGVIRANNEVEFVAAVSRVAAIVASDAAQNPRPCGDGQAPLTTHFLVEEFMAGPEVAVEGLLTRGRLRVLAIFDKPDSLDGPFFEETIYVTPSRLSADSQDAIAAVTSEACRALGLVHGPVHAELRLGSDIGNPQSTIHTPPSLRVIEVNPRSIGGLCSRVLRFGTGLSLEELILRHALDPEYSPAARERQAAGVMMIPIPRAGVLRQVRGVDDAKSLAGVEGVTILIHPGQPLVPLPEGSRYLGFIFARDESPAVVETTLRAAHSKLSYSLDDCSPD